MALQVDLWSNRSTDRSETAAVTCAGCGGPIASSDSRLTALGVKWHKDHFRCVVCSDSLHGQQYYEHAGQPYCHKDFVNCFAQRCAACDEPVMGAHITALDSHFHQTCFVCVVCRNPFEGGKFHKFEGKPYCTKDYQAMFGKTCVECGETIAGAFLTAFGKNFHPEHFCCKVCRKGLQGQLFAAKDGLPVCEPCAATELAQRVAVQRRLNEGAAAAPSKKKHAAEEPVAPATPPRAATAGTKAAAAPAAAPAAAAPAAAAAAPAASAGPAPVSAEQQAEGRRQAQVFATQTRSTLASIAANDRVQLKAQLAPLMEPVKAIIAMSKPVAPALSQKLQVCAAEVLSRAKAVFAAEDSAGEMIRLKSAIVQLAPAVADAVTAAVGKAQDEMRADAFLTLGAMLASQLEAFEVEAAELVIALTADFDEDLSESERLARSVSGESDESDAAAAAASAPKAGKPAAESHKETVGRRAALLVSRVFKSMQQLRATLASANEEVDWAPAHELAAGVVSIIRDREAELQRSPAVRDSMRAQVKRMCDVVRTLLAPFLARNDASEANIVRRPLGFNHRLESFGVGTATDERALSRFISDWQKDPTQFTAVGEGTAASSSSRRGGRGNDSKRRPTTTNFGDIEIAAGEPTARSGSSITGPSAALAAAAASAAAGEAPSRAGDLESIRVRQRGKNSAAGSRRRAVSMSLNMLAMARLSANASAVSETIKPFELQPTPASDTVEVQVILDTDSADSSMTLGEVADVLAPATLEAVAFVLETAVAGKADLAAQVLLGQGPKAALTDEEDANVVRPQVSVLMPASARGTEETVIQSKGEANASGELHPAVSGYLTLQRGMFNAWKQRFFLLENGVLYFMKLDKETIIDRLPVLGCSIITSPETSKEHAFALRVPEALGGDLVVLVADDEREKMKWITALTTVLRLDHSKTEGVSMREVNRRQSRMTLKRGRSFSVSGAARAEAAGHAMVKRKAIREAGVEVLVYIDGSLEGGLEDKLVGLLVQEGGGPSDEYITQFLLCFRHAIKPKLVLETIMGRFNSVAPPGANAEQLAYVDTWKPIVQERCVAFFERWATRCWFDFHDNEILVVGAMNFIALVREVPRLAARADALERLVEAQIHAFDELAASVSDAPGPTPNAGTAHIWGELGRFDPVVLARMLTIQELDTFVRIKPEEFTVQLWGDRSKPFLRAYSEPLSVYVNAFNRLSYWVAAEICLAPELKKRIGIMKAMVAIAQEFYAHQNYNGLMAVISGLNLASIQRLRRSWDGMPNKTMSLLHQLEEVMSPKSNYANYRLTAKTLPALPFFGLLLKDLTFLNDGNTKRLESAPNPRLINFDKWRRISTAVVDVCRYQASTYDFVRDEAALAFAEGCLAGVAVDEGSLYKYSLLCEPRGQTEYDPNQRLIEKWASAS